MGCTQKIEGSYRGSKWKTLREIEYIGRVAWLKNAKEECKILKERVLPNQFTIAKPQVFEIALDRYSRRDM